MYNIYFIIKDIKTGSSLLRAKQIKDKLLENINILNINILEIKNIKNIFNKENNILIWIGPIGNNYINKIHKNNIHILDIVDKYLYNKKLVIDSLNNNLYKTIIVNNKFMKDYFINNTKFKGNINIIYHHWDSRYSLTTTITNNKLIFGYLGSIKSLLHTDNFLFYDKLVKKYDIRFFDTELGKYVTENVKNNDINYNIKYNTNNIPYCLHFNCDINIRDPKSEISKFKTTAKLATSAALGHNIITTMDESIKDLLPNNYPFILKDTNYETIINMFELVIHDFNTNKILWNKGLDILKNIKFRLGLNNIIKEYIILFKND